MLQSSVLEAGHGVIALQRGSAPVSTARPEEDSRQEATADEHTAVFSALQASYPLKLICPTSRQIRSLGAVYLLSYGGGLVGGDNINVNISVDSELSLLALTQGSTKGAFVLVQEFSY